MKQIISKIRAAFASAPKVVSAQANVIMTGEGLMMSQAWPDGRFFSTAVQVPGAQGASGQWAIGRPINLSYVDEEGGQVALYMRVVGGAQEIEPIKVYVGLRQDAEQIAFSIQAAWIAANAGGGHSLAPGVVGGGAAAWGGAPGGHGYMGNATSSGAAYHQGATRSVWSVLRLWVFFPLLAIAVVAASWMAANRYLKPSGPGIDMSSMSIDEVAMLDANPAAVRQVQESLLEAVGVGRAQAAGSPGKIEQDHIDALKAMGLEPGVSMKNAMSCLAK